MSPEEQAEIFRICLQAIERGSETIDQCVARYPAMTDLREMLEVSLRAQRLPRVTLPAAQKRSLEQRLLSQLSARPLSELAVRRGASQWVRLALAPIVTVLVALGTGGVLVQASQSALPGD